MILAGKHALNRRVAHRKTLVVCPIGLGNYLMATPAFERLSGEIGANNLQLLALKPGIRDVAAASGWFGAVHLWDPDCEPWSVGLRTVVALRRERFDFSLSLFPTGDWKFALFGMLASARTRIGFAYPNSRMPERLQHFSAPLDPDAHDTDQNARLIDALIGTEDDRPRRLTYPIPPAHPREGELRRHSYVVCHPGSSAERGMADKRLPAEAFAFLIRRFDEELGIKSVLIGGPEEEPLRRDVRDRAPGSILDYGSANLAELAALISHSRCYVGNDSGLMHVSVALGKSCIAFFGPTDDRRNGPYEDMRYVDGGRHLIVRRNDLTCTPCRTLRTVGTQPPCVHGDIRCLAGLNIAHEWSAIRHFVSNVEQLGSAAA